MTESDLRLGLVITSAQGNITFQIGQFTQVVLGASFLDGKTKLAEIPMVGDTALRKDNMPGNRN